MIYVYMLMIQINVVNGSLKRFILRMIPIYDYENFYENNLVFDLEVMAFIKTSIKQLHITDLKSYFKKIQDSEKIEKQ